MAARVVLFGTVVALVIVGAFLTWQGLSGLLAQVPGVGDRGIVTVSRCETVDRGGVTCTGVFAASDGSAHTVSVQGADRVGVTVEATMFSWDDSRAYARGAGPGAVGTTVLGGAVLGIGVTGTVVVTRNVRRFGG